MRYVHVKAGCWATLLTLLYPASAALANGNIAGHGRFERIKGQPQMGYVELYETNLFLSPPVSSAIGPSRRLGTTCMDGAVCNTQTITSDGCYCVSNLPSGTYSILMNQPLFFISPKVVSNVVIPNGGQTLTLNPLLPVDYSSYFRDSGQWTGPGTTWYQTFTATGTGCRGISFNVAGAPAVSVEVALLEDNGNPDVRNWRLVVTRVEPRVVADGDNWVRFRSPEAPMTPGKKYAVRLRAIATGTIQPYKRNKDANSYAGGQAYDELGQAQPFDLTLVVFADNDGTLVTMNRRETGLGWLCDNDFFGQRWGQTFIAHGRGLAGADVFAAGASNRWDLKFAWKVRENGPTGAQIGPTKITEAAFQAHGAGLHGVSYNPGEVPLVAGSTYFIEFSIVDPPPESNGFNPYLMHPSPGASCGGGDAADDFPEGIAYRDNVARPADDVNMTIIEYSIPGREIGVSPQQLTRTSYPGDPIPDDVLLIGNNGNQPMTYTLADNAPWLSLSPTSGSSTGEQDAITVSYNAGSLPVGEHHAQITITAPDAENSPLAVPVTLVIKTVAPDFDGDTDVDQDDFGVFQKCLTGPGIPSTHPACQAADLDGDEDVDQTDFQSFLACVSGPNQAAERDCDD